MNSEYSITFRLPKKFSALAEEYLLESGEKNLNPLAQKLLVAELEKRHSKSESSISKFDDESVQFLLAAIGNSRELLLRLFEILFFPENAQKKFTETVEELQIDWSALIQMFTRRMLAPGTAPDTFAADTASEVDQIFDERIIQPAPEDFVPGALISAENNSPERLRQGSLFD